MYKLLPMTFCFLLVGCTSLLKDADQTLVKEVELNNEFEEMVQIKKQPEETKTKPEKKALRANKEDTDKKQAVKSSKKQKEAQKQKAKDIAEQKKTKVSKSKQKSDQVKKGKSMQEDQVQEVDTVEDKTGFEGRRPIHDPFRVGEKVVLDLSYFSMSAGKLTMEVLPFSEVNGNKTYTFRIDVKSSKMFSLFYKVDNWAETYVDYEKLVPYSHVVQTRETNQIKDSKSFFNWEENEAIFWEKKLTDKSKQPKVEKSTWELKPYAQNVISSIFYIRTFAYKDDKPYPFRVADEGKNIIFTSQVVDRETLKTKAGTFKTIKIKPKFTVNGTFKPVGDIFLWMTDDHRKLIVRIEAKIKIGSIVGEAEKVVLGKD